VDLITSLVFAGLRLCGAAGFDCRRKTKEQPRALEENRRLGLGHSRDWRVESSLCKRGREHQSSEEDAEAAEERTVK